MTQQLNIVVLAAGKGTRMRSALPKVLHTLAGLPMLVHVLDTARMLVPDKLCVVYGYGGDTVAQAINASDVIWVCQAEQKGTGHAVQQAIPYLQTDAIVLILFGDVPLIQAKTFQQVISQAQQDQLVLLTVDQDDPAGYGRILRDAQGNISGIVEHKDASEQQRGIREINTGIMAMPAARLVDWLQRLGCDNVQSEYYLTDIVAMAVADGFGVTSVHAQNPSEVFGVNSKSDLAQLERIYQRQVADTLMEQGVSMADPARLDVRGSVQCGQDVTIDVNCVFEGKVVLGDSVTIGANCVIRDANIGDHTVIAPFSHIESASIGQRCRIGPYARIRPGTELASGVHIGNFVEIKNSEIGAESSINHLSYVGDSTVGKDVNIGAGTITCNYDGANKHRTVIEDGAFIGSDSQLVAPVTIGRGATIAAGSTITRDAPAGELSVSRARQTTVHGWKRPKKQ